ncbi:hypothetical protein C8C99_2073 [Acidovorax sp. 107]|nr:hypothetical protein C8C99_2073 [Acidovorax sp. 107]
MNRGEPEGNNPLYRGCQGAQSGNNGGAAPLAFCTHSTKDHPVAAAKKSPPAAMGRAPNTAAPDAATTGPAASALIDQRIADLGDWRGQVLAQVRQLIHEAAPGVVEEWKWRGTPVWSLGGILCTGESYKAAVKLTFLKGAALPDPARLFNASLDGNARRAIDIHEGDTLPADAFRALIRAAVELNALGSSKARKGRAPGHIGSAA